MFILFHSPCSFSADVTVEWHNLTTRYPKPIMGVGIAIHDYTIYGFGGRSITTTTTLNSTTSVGITTRSVHWLSFFNLIYGPYYQPISNDAPTTDDPIQPSWDEYIWLNDTSTGYNMTINDFQCNPSSNLPIINDIVYIVSPIRHQGMILAFNTSSKKQVSLDRYNYTLPKYNRTSIISHPCSVGNGTHVFIMGGIIYGSKPDDVYINVSYVLNIEKNNWIRLADINSPGRKWGSCNYDDISNRIYFIGGQSTGDVILDSIEYYDINNDIWIMIEPNIVGNAGSIDQQMSLMFLNGYDKLFNDLRTELTDDSGYSTIIGDISDYFNDFLFIIGGRINKTITDKVSVVTIEEQNNINMDDYNYTWKFNFGGFNYNYQDLILGTRKFGGNWLDNIPWIYWRTLFPQYGVHYPYFNISCLNNDWSAEFCYSYNEITVSEGTETDIIGYEVEIDKLAIIVGGYITDSGDTPTDTIQIGVIKHKTFIESNTTLFLPIVANATFSNDFLEIYVSFFINASGDIDVTMYDIMLHKDTFGGNGNNNIAAVEFVDCNLVFNQTTMNILSDYVTCQWNSNDATITVTLDGLSTIQTDDVLIIKDNVVQYESNNNKNVSNTETIIDIGVTENKIQLTKPQIVLTNLQEMIGICDDVILDARNSYHLGMLFFFSSFFFLFTPVPVTRTHVHYHCN